MDSINFGVGCFHFGFKQEEVKMNGEQYLEHLKRVLSSISNINNIDFKHDDYFIESELELNKKLELDEGDPPFPNPKFLQIKFDIYIPKRIQSKYFDKIEFPFKPVIENFKVNITYSYFMPVCFIYSFEHCYQDFPSDAILVIREFLKENVIDDIINFQCIGPSPFHADFNLQEKRKDSKSKYFLESIVNKENTYSSINFYIDDFNDNTFEEKVNLLFFELNDELALYYRITSFNNQIMNGWMEIQDKLEEFQKTFRNISFISSLKSPSLRVKKINELYLNIIDFEILLLGLNRSFMDSFNVIYNRKHYYLKSFNENYLQDSNEYPIEQINKIISLHDKRFTKNIDLIVLLVTALIGGLVGSILAIIVN